MEYLSAEAHNIIEIISICIIHITNLLHAYFVFHSAGMLLAFADPTNPTTRLLQSPASTDSNVEVFHAGRADGFSSFETRPLRQSTAKSIAQRLAVARP